MSLFPTNTIISSIASLFTTGTPYLALYTSSPTAAGGGTEVSGGSYTRKAITFGSLSGGSVSNTVAIAFTNLPTATVSHYAILDAATGGTMRAYGALSSTAAAVSGDEINFGVGSVQVTIAGS